MTTPATSTIWVLEDDPGCAFVLEMVLGKRHHVRLFGRLAEMREALATTAPPALLIADFCLPDGTLADVLADKDGRGPPLGVPLMVVSSVGEESMLRHCFDLGAVDYLVKPFHQNELLVKVDRWLEKRHAATSGIRVDPRSMCIFNGEKASPLLTARELQIVTLLQEEMPKPMTRRSIEQTLWANLRVSPKTLDVHMFNIRRKLAGIDLAIECSVGGFRLRTDPTERSSPVS